MITLVRHVSVSVVHRTVSDSQRVFRCHPRRPSRPEHALQRNPRPAEIRLRHEHDHRSGPYESIISRVRSGDRAVANHALGPWRAFSENRGTGAARFSGRGGAERLRVAFAEVHCDDAPRRIAGDGEPQSERGATERRLCDATFGHGVAPAGRHVADQRTRSGPGVGNRHQAAFDTATITAMIVIVLRQFFSQNFAIEFYSTTPAA